jgi:hypothetical protein
MLWLNIPTEFLGSAEFLGCEPVERATWLSLMGHCAIAENGGRIVGALDWKDRKWQQVVGVTLEEVNSDCELWEWDGDDLILPHYPEEKEAEVQAKREAGRQGGLKRWKNQKAKQSDSSANSNPTSSVNSSAIKEPYTERNGTEPKRNGTEKAPGGATVAPLPFSSTQFQEAWEMWEQHRKEKRQKVTPTARKQQLAKLEALGEAKSIAAIQHSVANGYTGIFEPNENTLGNRNGNGRTTDRNANTCNDPNDYA